MMQRLFSSVTKRSRWWQWPRVLTFALSALLLVVASRSRLLADTAGTITVRVEPATQAVPINGTFAVDIVADLGTEMDPEGLGGYEFDLVDALGYTEAITAYDAGDLTSTGRSLGTLGPSITNSSEITVSFGAYSLPPPDNGPTATVTLATVEFEAKETGVLTLTLENVRLADTGGTGWPGAGGSTNLEAGTVTVEEAGTVWYLAEGYTGGNFDTYILLQNPGATGATVDVTYMVQGGSNITKTHMVPGNSRYTIHANDGGQVGPGKGFSTKAVSDQPIIVERAMYWDAGGDHWAGGHDTLGVNAPQLTWYLAEGYTGGSYDTYILLQNPNATAATVDVTYMVQGGSNITKTHVVPGDSRYTIHANDGGQVGPGKGFSTKAVADQPIIVERAMYWDAGGDHWAGGHATTGVNAPQLTWYLAEGYTGGSYDTYILLQNPSVTAATVDVTYMVQGGSNITKTHVVPGDSRYTIHANDGGQVGPGKGFSTKAVSDQPIIVERAMYWDAGGEHWAGGHGTIGVNAPQLTWYLAEGYTGGSYDTYILLQNPNATAVTVDLTYMVEGGSNITKTHGVPGNSRYTVHANDSGQAGPGKGFSTKAASDQPIIVERAMYWDAGGAHWAEGHDTVGASGNPD